MKKNTLLLSASVATGVFLLLFATGCLKGSGKSLTHATVYTPTYGSVASVLAKINGSPSTSIGSAGKIYVWGTKIFISEPDKGIHVLDNSDPTRPRQVAFLAIPGNQDIAIKGNTLYADMYTDLLALDISNLLKVSITGRIQNFFTSRFYANGHYTMANGLIATSWAKKDTLISSDTYYYPGGGPNCANCATMLNAASSSSSTATGVAGSMASMVVINDHIYALTEAHNLGIVDISHAATPVHDSTFFAGYDMETIYPFKDKLFLGSSSGVFIYDVSDPTHPTKTGTFYHGRACDPVITDGDYAYITLHAGTWCGGASNELDVVDVKNLSTPSMVKVYPMTKPTGLAKDGNILFVGDGNAGVKVFDCKDPANLKQLEVVNSGQAYDVIAGNNKLLIVSDNGLYQYSYSDGKNINLLSRYIIGN